MPALAANPEWQQATGLYASGNYSGALSAFRKLAEKSPRDASIHYMIGQCYKGLNKLQQANSEFDWVSKYAPDAQTKAMAKAMLGQMPSSAGTPSTSASAAPVALNAVGVEPAPNAFVNDSAEQTIAVAARKGWIPCSGGCLNYRTPGWHHQHVDGHPETDMWMSYPNSVNTQFYSQYHIGHMIKEFPDKAAEDTGACPRCNGTGWVRAK
ncbi:MAG: tetratricopeptide repeat protein [Candidatus Obscuribacterales bacterium]|nr:tetratricopeptide repeat protein [Candidatus Obscuribacterales bacterium]